MISTWCRNPKIFSCHVFLKSGLSCTESWDSGCIRGKSPLPRQVKESASWERCSSGGVPTSIRKSGAGLMRDCWMSLHSKMTPTAYCVAANQLFVLSVTSLDHSTAATPRPNHHRKSHPSPHGSPSHSPMNMDPMPRHPRPRQQRVQHSLRAVLRGGPQVVVHPKPRINGSLIKQMLMSSLSIVMAINL